MATRTDTKSPALHDADSHDLIRVQGARMNNLKDIHVEIPKRRLTTFTGVSGSGKRSMTGYSREKFPHWSDAQEYGWRLPSSTPSPGSSGCLPCP